MPLSGVAQLLHDPFQGFAQLRDFRRRGVLHWKIDIANIAARGERLLAADIAARGSKVLDPMPALAQRNHDQQRPQAVPIGQVELAFRLPLKETVENRLRDVFGIKLGPQALVEPAPCQRQQSLRIALEDPGGSLRIALLQPVHHLKKGITAGHGIAPPTSPRHP